MYHITLYCDICGNSLPIKQVTTPFGTINIVEMGKTMVWDTRHVFGHLCKECALRIDNELLKAKLDLLEKRG